jgi:hypothetical protein
MRKAPYALAVSLVLVATTGLAGTKIGGNLSPVPSDCNSGPDFCKNGLPQSFSCAADNSDCTGATLAKAKFSLKDTLQLKVSVSKLADNDGNLVTTSTGNALDDHILKLSVNRCIVDNGAPTNCQNPRDIYVKLDYTGGKAKAVVDLSVVLGDPSLTAIGITSATVGAGASNLASCPGTNSAADIAARMDDADCDGALPYLIYGIVKP